ncbi:hypothetical protein GT347_18900 [Xylophilus rhododendri]|uniref:Uncharacterized protein n=1 Tax=Xylophilus rhododendri TaxID=2697032 RepID=A0A857J829_9BURK|nr:hypothetical protein [Xylophilus rhododendri]QHI99867.1 hypothetical protein GT347_18900 [Xylophilus rhododendri]
MQGPTDAELHQAQELIEQIVLLAATADRLCHHFPADSEDLERHRDHADVLRQIIQRLGWTADAAACALAPERTTGDAACWLLPMTPR